MKYKTHAQKLIFSAIRSQPEWLIEENAKILLIDDWTNPPKAPIRAEAMIKKLRATLIKGLDKHQIQSINGANFCQTRIIKQLTQLKPPTT